MSYPELYQSGEIKNRVRKARSLLESCRVCPRECSVNRLNNEKGTCQTGAQAMVSSFGAHFGEEKPLVSKHGSGTIFFTNCNLQCVYCQNYEISQLGQGEKVSRENLAQMMLSLQNQGCHNINLVSPTHVVPQILEALEIAVQLGLHIPLVYNSGGYDSLEILAILDGIIDIYMPDMKYSDEKTAKKLSGITNYPAINRAAVKEMHRQTGDLKMDENGVARKGLLVRHLVLPDGLAGTPETISFIADEISTNTYVNVMDQYYPSYRAREVPSLTRRITREEYQEALRLAREAGLHRLDKVHLPIL